MEHIKTHNLNQYFMILAFGTLLFFVINVSFGYAQSDIKIYKTQLEKLNQDLKEVDSQQRDELSELQKQSSEKGEFETTSQFEERSKKEDAQWHLLYSAINYQQGIKREKIYKEINQILSKEFPGNFQATLGIYNADKQLFPLLTNSSFQGYIFVPLEEARELKENFSKTEKIGTLGLALDSKNRAIDYLISGKIKYKGKIYNINTNPFDNARAMRMLFGNYDENSKYSAWTLELPKFYLNGSDEDVYVPITVFAKILSVKSYTDNKNVEKRVVIAQTSPTLEDNSCQACSVFISVAVFSKQNGYWKLEQAQKNTGGYGSYGEISPPTIQKIGLDHYALKYEWSDIHMGNAEGGEEFITLDGGTFNLILDIYTYSDNIASMVPIKDQVSTKSKVTFKPDSNLEYFDVVVNTSGKKGQKVGKRFMLYPFTKTEFYRVINGKYQLITK